ncbi:hypothetical protein HPB49_004881 [Dermacentor silvarum]|uniref:Uncharacterized protein n=1 Tax=Dermacentor silvarum TaxID=543639 RepID=A0ACB8DMI4_DERSI|nr:hypothetical protein HPB49_004881 [Dermacentor silvarum]
MHGDELNLNCAGGTAHFIGLILKWWHVVNVKSPSKGRRLRDPLQDPVRSLTGKQIEFLNFLHWLDTWRDIKMDTGALPMETHSALRLTCYSLVELCHYCLEELNFDYVLLGKFQTDRLGSDRKVRTVPAAVRNELSHLNAASVPSRRKN